MAYSIKTWVDRESEFPNRRTLTPVSGQTDTVDVARAEGTVSVQGDAFDAANMNDLESRISAGFAEAQPAFDILPVAPGGTGATSLADITVGNAEAIGGTPYTCVSIFNFFSRVDLFEKVKSMPNNSCGVYRNDGTCTGLPINGNGGTGYWIKTSEADAEILWLSLTGAKAHYRYLAGGTDSGWIDFDAPKWGGYKNWVGTQSEYNSIPKKDPNTLYFIVG